MQAILNLQRKIVPELADLIELRYELLRQIALNQPVGRRVLSAKSGLSERVLRSQVDFLKEAGLVCFTSLGMSITEEGQYLLTKLASYIKELHGLNKLEKSIKETLKLEQVVIVPGDSEENEISFHDLAYNAANVLKEQILAGAKSVAISGGTTMRKLVEAVTYTAKGLLVLPARGGLGDDAKHQANTIAAFLAGKLGASYRQLYIPDKLSKKTLSGLLAEDEDLRKVLELMRSAAVMVHGIGKAESMAKRRGAPSEKLAQLSSAGAVGEALGKYYNLQGKEVHLEKNSAILLDDFSKIGQVIAVAGGKSKAEAILAVCRAGKLKILVTDYAAAQELKLKL